ncbi:FAD:protein FMN transferase [Nocardioides sp.]|uniref:FAD:protein FMN transferase n=1 Tax=Nocardioides sp. TaxID=35761 RepID=UPI002ED7D94D
MSTRTWRDWSCTVRVVLAQDRTVAMGPADEAARIVEELMRDVDAAVSRFRADSELERVNDAAPRLVPVSPLARALVEVALDAARRTDGAVDPTVGAHLLALGYDAEFELVRDRIAAPARPVARGDWTQVVVDRELGRIGVPRGLRLDLGATAKAWTADEAARRVFERLRVPALVEIGGDLAVAGEATEPWRVRVAETEDGPGELVGITHGGLATSSVTGRRWRTRSGAAHHVVDPATGRPVTGSVRTATVWAASAADANASSTAALVWGEAAAARLSLAGVDARLVDRAGAVRRVGSWPEEVPAA